MSVSKAELADEKFEEAEELKARRRRARARGAARGTERDSDVGSSTDYELFVPRIANL